MARRLFSVLGLAITFAASSAFAQTSDLKIETVPNVLHTPYSLSFSPDNLRVVGGDGDGTVNLLDLPTGRLLRRMTGHTDHVKAVAFLANGQQVLSASKDKTVKLWDAVTGRLLRTTSLNVPGDIAALAISPDGSQVLSGTFEKEMNLWDAATGRRLRAFPIERQCIGNKHYSSCSTSGTYAVAFSPDGKRVISGTTGLAKVWDTGTGNLLLTLKGDQFASVGGVAFSADGTRIVTSGGKTVRLWDARTGQLLQQFAHSDFLRDNIAFSPDSRRIFSSDSKKMILWDTATGRAVSTIDGSPYNARFSADSKQLMFGSWDDAARIQLRLSNADDGRVVREFGSDQRSLGSAGFSNDGAHIISGGFSFAEWNAKTGQLHASLPAANDGLFTSAFSRDGARILRHKNYQHAVRLIDTVTGKTLNTFKAQHKLSNVALSPDGSRALLVGVPEQGLDSVIELLETSTGRVLRTFKAQQVNAVAFSPDNSRVLSANFDKTAKLWEANSGQLLRTFVHAEPVKTIAFSPDGTRILTGDGGKTVSLWEISSGRRLRTFEGHTGPIYHGVAFSPDGSRALSASYDKTVKLWDVATGRLLRSMNVDSRQPAFSPDGRHALLLGAIWNLETGEPLATIYTSANNEWLTITPEGFFAASAKGADLLSVVRGFEIYSIDQFYQALYRPDLVREKLAGDTRGLVREAAARLDLDKTLASGNAPSVTLVSPRDGDRATAGQINAEIDIINRDGGIGRVEWRVNGITIGVDAAPAAPPAGQSLRLTRSLGLTAGNNEVEVVAYNGANLIASVPARAIVTLEVPGAAPGPVAADARLFVLAAGVNDYADQRFRLAHAVSDAKVTAQAFGTAGRGHYQSVTVKVLSDADVSKEKLDAAFTELATQVRPADVFVLYLAGHGKSVDGRYYFVPQAFRIDGEATNATINNSVTRQGIAQDQWQSWLAQVPARRSLILLDTCESGTLTADETDTKVLERGAANDRLAQATGRSIITASTGNTEAFEGYRGHGLFTYNLLDAIERGDSDANGTIDVSELAAYVYAQVTTLSEQVFKQRQAPQIKITTNYALTRQIRVLPDALPAVAMEAKPTHQLAQTAQVAIRPGVAQTAVRSLTANTPITVLKSEGRWALIAQQGRPIGYVATKDLAPIR